MDPGVRIAMWSGPRNISTAMMRCWGNRPDTVCWDEPFYAWYLKETGLDHPARAEIIAAHESNWREVVQRIEGRVPTDASIHFLKCMTHHMLPQMSRNWLAGVRHFFLVRDPERMLRSYAATRKDFTVAELGLRLQLELFEEVTRASGAAPPVVASEDILADPRKMLVKLCAALDVPFMEKMLAWPPGPRPEDGVWAKHWYGSVHKSTGFSKPSDSTHPLPDHLKPMLDELYADYAPLVTHKL